MKNWMHKIMYQMLVIPIMILAMGQAFASICDNQEYKTLSFFKNITQKATQYFEQCKILPYATNQALVAIASSVDVATDDQKYQLNLFLVNTDSGKLLKRYQDPDVIISDAIALSGLSLDTANYQVNPKLRAIGIRLSYTGASRVNPYHPEVLNLYDLQHDKKILNGFMVGLSRAEWDGRCAGEWEERESTLHILKQQQHGFSDIEIRTKLSVEESVGDTQSCKSIQTKDNRSRFTLKFDGQQYQIPRQYQQEFSY